MITFGNPNIIIEEKIDYKTNKTMYAFVQSDSESIQDFRYNFNTIIKRFAAQDLYSIVSQYDGNLNQNTLSHDRHGHELVAIINNKIKLKKAFVLGERDYEVDDGKILFHHSEITKKFRETNYLFTFLNAREVYGGYGGNRRFNDNRNPLFNKLISYATFLKFPEFQKNYKTPSNGIVKMKFLKDMSIREIQKPFLKRYSKVKSQVIKHFGKTQKITPYFSYSEFFIKFNELDWINHNHEIATIYWKPSNRNQVFDSDFQFQRNSHLKIGTKKYAVTFRKSQNIAKGLANFNFKDPFKVGKIVLSDFTSYDYKKKKATNDVNEFSERGIFIPYNFKGKFFYKIQLGINEIFKDLEFFVYQDVPQKALDPYAGKIRVSVTTSNVAQSKPNSNTVTISSNYFKKVIDLGEDIHPLAIARLGNVKEEEE